MARRTSLVSLRAIKPNAGIRAAYARTLRALVRSMRDEIDATVESAYRTELAMDAAPSKPIERTLAQLKERLQRNADKIARPAAEEFVLQVQRHVERARRSAVNDAPRYPELQTVRFSLQSVPVETFEALTSANVALIKKISREYLSGVEQLVWNAVLEGRKVNWLRKELAHRYGVTIRRADFIARDQCNKATESVTRAADVAAGAVEGEWIHIPGKYTSRESHKAMHGKRFDLSKGMYDPEAGEYVFPGQLPGCNCVYRAVFTKKIWERNS